MKQLFFFMHCTNYTTASPKYSTTNTWRTFNKSWTTLGSISPSWSQTWCQQLGNGSEIRWRILTSRKEKLKRIYETIYNPQKSFTWMQPSLLEWSTVSNTRWSYFFLLLFLTSSTCWNKIRAVIKIWAPGISPRYFHRIIEEKSDQKKSLAVWFPAYLLYLPGNLKS